jgi:RHS repeat-associated protein
VSAALALVEPETADPGVVVDLADYRERRRLAALRSASGSSSPEPKLASEPGLYRYTAFGEAYTNDTTDYPAPTGVNALPVRWKGRWLAYSANMGTANQVELYDMRARWWSPQLGVFVSVDQFAYHDPNSTLWGWGGQSPLRWNDPSGNCPACVAAAVGYEVGFIGGALYYAATAPTNLSWGQFASNALGFAGETGAAAAIGAAGGAVAGTALAGGSVGSALGLGAAAGTGAAQSCSASAGGIGAPTAGVIGQGIGMALRGGAGKMAGIAQGVTNAALSQANASEATQAAVEALGLRSAATTVGSDVVVASVMMGSDKPVLIVQAGGQVVQGLADLAVANGQFVVSNVRPH